MKKSFDYGEVNSVKDAANENLMEAQDPSSSSLFSAYPASTVSDANDSGEIQSTVGK